MLTQNELLNRTAALERRSEMGSHLPKASKQWLASSNKPERWALWQELLNTADIHGVCELSSLVAWQYFNTRQRQYLVTGMIQRGLIAALGEGRVQLLV